MSKLKNKHIYETKVKFCHSQKIFKKLSAKTIFLCASVILLKYSVQEKISKNFEHIDAHNLKEYIYN